MQKVGMCWVCCRPAVNTCASCGKMVCNMCLDPASGCCHRCRKNDRLRNLKDPVMME